MLVPLLLAITACGQAQAGRDVVPSAADPPLRVTRGPLIDRVVLTGELAAAQATSITVPRSPTWQTQIRWIADDGSRVAKGDKVMELDNSSWKCRCRTRSVTRSAATVAQAV